MKNSIPLCFYPTRKILLDDDDIFSQSILLKMYGKNFLSMNSFTEAIKYLTEEYCPEITKNSLQEFIEKGDSQDISILYIDYHMPDMLGTDFLKRISNLNTKKVLVTGEHDYQIAIEAFNNGLIDAYIRKSDPDFFAKIQHINSELEWKYFSDMSQIISEEPDLKYLTDKNFIKFFIEYLVDKNIKSFHLIDRQGTFRMRNNLDETQYFVFRNMAQLKQLSEFAAEDGASEDTITSIAQGKTIPFFNLKESWEIPAVEWDKYLCFANEVPGDSDFFWTTMKSIS